MRLRIITFGIAVSLFAFSFPLTTSIYNQHFIALNGDTVSLSQFQGKKMLIVNMASESSNAAEQIPQLEQLFQQYRDSLVVIGFFSNDFGNEPREDNVLKLLMINNYHATFPVSQRIGVKDSTGSTHPLYHWLQYKSENGMMDVKVSKDFQKFLVDKDGTLIGFFGSRVTPMDAKIINAITH